MLNYVWLGLIVIAILMGAATGNIEAAPKQRSKSRWG